MKVSAKDMNIFNIGYFFPEIFIEFNLRDSLNHL